MKQCPTSILSQTLLAAVALAGAVTFAQTPPASGTTATPANANPVIISAGDVTILKSDFEAALGTLPAEYQQYAKGAGRKQFGQDFLRMKLLATAGTKAGLDRSPEVTRQLALMKENLIATEQMRVMEKGISVSEANVKAAYEENKKDYEQVKARHILIAFQGGPAAQANKKSLTDAEARAKADGLRERLVGGGDFAALAKQESDDVGSGANGGDLGAFGRAQMVPEFEQAAFAAKPGEISAVVKSSFGYHIIQVQDHTFVPLVEVKAAIEKNLRQKKLQEALEALIGGAKPIFDESYFPSADQPEAKKS
jgi:parvulin-like peptidyl-prolyl isomerase